MYTIILTLHSWVRWVALLGGIAAAVKAILGVLQKGTWSELDNRLGLIFTSGIDTQFLLGLILYGISPITTSAFSDMGAAMSNGDIRFFVVEHVITMLVAIVLAHIGRSRSKKAADSSAKFRIAAIFFTIAVLAMLTGIPWARPLFRLG